MWQSESLSLTKTPEWSFPLSVEYWESASSLSPADIEGVCIGRAVAGGWQVREYSDARFVAFLPNRAGLYFWGTKLAVLMEPQSEESDVLLVVWSTFERRWRLRRQARPLAQELGLRPAEPGRLAHGRALRFWSPVTKALELSPIPLLLVSIFTWRYWQGPQVYVIYGWVVLLPVIIGFDVAWRRILGIHILRDLVVQWGLVYIWAITLGIMMILGKV